MPKLKKKFDPYERYKGLILARKMILGYSNREIAQRMGSSEPTVSRKLRNPGSMELDYMRSLHRILDITAEDARAALPMK